MSSSASSPPWDFASEQSPCRVAGTEVEYGIAFSSGEIGDLSAQISHELVGSLPEEYSGGALWDYEPEDPFHDARGFYVEGQRERPDRGENRRTNRALYNGGRFYVDGGHPEYSAPECRSLRDILRFERAGDRLVELAMHRWERNDRQGRSLRIFRNNADGFGNSWGYHENYLVARALPFERIVSGLTAHLVSRPIFCGAGKVASDRGRGGGFQISQRAEFFEVPVGLSTTARRGIVNTRDEPHSLHERYRRLHVITGDSNCSEVSTALKVGTTMLLLAALEGSTAHDQAAGIPVLLDPVSAFHAVSSDLTLKAPLPLADGKTLGVLDLAGEVFLFVKDFYLREGMGPETRETLDRWESVLSRLGTMSLAQGESRGLDREIDWVIKKGLLDRYAESRSIPSGDGRLRMIDLQYHDIRSDRGLFRLLESRGEVLRILDPQEIEEALLSPPADTRAYFRGTLLRRFSREVVAVSWSSAVVDDGSSSLKRIPLEDPCRGTQKIAGALIERHVTAAGLLAELASGQNPGAGSVNAKET